MATCPLVELLQRLTRDSFRGTIKVELNPDVLQAEDEALVQTQLRRAAQFCFAHTGRNPESQGQESG